MATIQKITPNLWFEKQAEEAAKYYVSIFKNSKLGRISYYSKAGYDQHKMPEGSVMTVEFEIEGQKFLALNGGPLFKFNESISFIVSCKNQEEIDYYWDKLTPGGDKDSQQCGWLKDKFGLSWQVSPAILDEMMADKDQKKVDRVTEAFMKMKKMNIAKLEDAFNGKS
ncbi:MAG: VOC family protein [Cyclobacteriaceae bacterium]|nr:VOC family protein [Cyclobacteriaceae bacterium]